VIFFNRFRHARRRRYFKQNIIQRPRRAILTVMAGAAIYLRGFIGYFDVVL